MPEPPTTSPIKLIAIDIDGTLLREDKRISIHTIETIHRVQEEGIRVILSTARPPRSTSELADLLKINNLQINYNGALILNPQHKRPFYHQPLDPTLTKKMIKLARKIDPQVVVSLEILDKWYTDHVDDRLPTETSRFFSPDFVGPLNAFWHVPVTKLLLLAPPKRIATLHEKLKEKFATLVSTAISDDYLLQYIHKDVDKSLALARVAKHYGIEAKEVMAIGDAPNDIKMLQWAGLGVAMENGWPTAKKSANIIAPSNDDNGVAYVIEKYCLNANH